MKIALHFFCSVLFLGALSGISGGAQAMRNPFSFGRSVPHEILAKGIIHDLDLEVCAFVNEENALQVKTSKIKSPST